MSLEKTRRAETYRKQSSGNLWKRSHLIGDGKGSSAYNSTDALCTLMGTRPPSAPVTVVPISGASVEFKVQSEDQEVRDENSSFGRLLIGKTIGWKLYLSGNDVKNRSFSFIGREILCLERGFITEMSKKDIIVRQMKMCYGIKRPVQSRVEPLLTGNGRHSREKSSSSSRNGFSKEHKSFVVKSQKALESCSLRSALEKSCLHQRKNFRPKRLQF